MPKTRRVVLKFGGGLNLKAAADEIRPDEFTVLQNARLDEYGNLCRRLGKQKLHATKVADHITSFFTTGEKLQRGDLDAAYLVFASNGEAHLLEL